MAKTWNIVNLVFVGLILFSLNGGSNVEGLGVNWGTISSHKLPPETVVQLLKDNGIKKVKLFDADESPLNALADSGIEVMVAVTNNELAPMNSLKNATLWVKENVLKYLSKKVNITFVAVGNEPYLKDYKDRFVNVTLPALKNIQKALDDAGVGKQIKATVPFNGDVYYSPSWNPVPSAGLFRPDIADSVTEIVNFLDKNGAPFIVNIYPFLSLYMSKGAFPLDYAFFDGGNSIFDGKIKYTNVFDANYDTCVSALKAAGYENMTVVVGEIGWPTDGNVFANVTLASRFYNGMLPRLGADKGTPLRPGYVEVYLFGLLDEDGKSTLPGDFERHWGIFRYDGQPKFPMDFSGKEKNKTLVGAKDVEYQPKQWCVLNPKAANATKIQENADYACEKADCTALAYGGSCSGLKDDDKTSYSFNAYFQWANQTEGSCDFEGLATLSTKDLSTLSCNFSVQLAVAPPTPAPTPSVEGPSSPAGEADEQGSSKGGAHSSAAPPPAMQSLVALMFLAIVSFLLL